MHRTYIYISVNAHICIHICIEREREREGGEQKREKERNYSAAIGFRSSAKPRILNHLGPCMHHWQGSRINHWQTALSTANPFPEPLRGQLFE